MTYRGIHHGLRQRVAAARLHNFAVQACLLAGDAHPPLVEDALVDHADDGDAAVHQPDQRPEQGLPSDERLGAVDWVQHPHPFRSRPNVAVLLAVDSVSGVTLLNQFAHRLFRLPVSDSHRAFIDRPVALDFGLDFNRLPPVRQYHLASCARELIRKGRELFQLWILTQHRRAA